MIKNNVRRSNEIKNERTPESEYMLYFLYSFLIVLTPIPSALLLKIQDTFKSTPLAIILYIVAILLNSYLCFHFFFKMVNYFKERRLLLILIVFISVLFFFLFMLSFCLYLIGYFSNFIMLKVAHPEYIINNLTRMMDYTIDIYVIVSSISIIVMTIVLFSYMLNMFLPKKLQRTDINFKQKINRFFLKIAYFILILAIIFVFSITNKSNFGAISIFTSLFVFACTPKTFLIIFSDVKNLNDVKISDSITGRFEFLKFMYYEIVFSWAISIYFFDYNEFNYKIYSFLAVFFVLFVITFLSIYFVKEKYKVNFKEWIENDDIK